MVNIRTEAENQQLANVDQYVAAQSLNLIAQVTEDGQNITQFLDLPSQIGNQEYSLCLANDSYSAWVGSGFGTTVQDQPQIWIPAQIDASGTFTSGWGRPFLQCNCENQTVTLKLSSE
jgi:hypothetical protein